MKQNENIESLFHRHFSEEGHQPSDWNTPSDELWEAAKIHFPKKKKKRRFIWLFFFPLGMGLIYAFMSFPFGTKEEATVIHQPLNISDELKFPESARQIEATSIHAMPVAEEVETKDSDHINESHAAATKQIISNTDEQARHQITTYNGPQSDMMPASVVPSAPNEINSKEPIQLSSDRKPIGILNTLEETRPIVSQTSSQSTSSVLISGTSEVAAKAPANSIGKVDLLSLSEFDIAPMSWKYDRLIPKRKEPRHKFWEVGMSYAPLIFNPASAANDDGGISANETFRLTTKYTNLNGIVRRQFHPRWSVASGIYYSSLQVNFRFTAIDTYKPSGTFKVQLDENVRVGALDLDGDRTDISLSYRPDAGLQEGDELLLEGFIPIDFKAWQLPLTVQYQIPGRRINWVFRSMAALDVFKASVDYLDLAVYKGATLVTDPPEYKPVSALGAGFSFYLGGGLEYKFSDRWRLAATSNIDLMQLIFSRHEIGLYYRL